MSKIEEESSKGRYIVGYMSKHNEWHNIQRVHVPKIIGDGLAAYWDAYYPKLVYPIRDGVIADYTIENLLYIARGPISDADDARLAELHDEWEKASKVASEAFSKYAKAFAQIAKYAPRVQI